jgi:hypothetical protein
VTSLLLFNFHFKKEFSIGFKNGEYGGKNNNLKPVSSNSS